MLVTALLWRRRRAGDRVRAWRRPFVACLGWQAVGAVVAAWGHVQLMDQEGSGKHHFEPVTPPPFLGREMCSCQSFPMWVITGQVRIFLIDSILVGFSVLLPCCWGCVVRDFLGGGDSSFISWGARRSRCMAVMLWP